jgi:hypothetical protein
MKVQKVSPDKPFAVRTECKGCGELNPFTLCDRCMYEMSRRPTLTYFNGVLTGCILPNGAIVDWTRPETNTDRNLEVHPF